MRFSTCLFDLDDTLYLERTFVEGGLRAAAETLARGSAAEPNRVLSRMLALLESQGRGRIFDTIAKELGLSDPYVAQALLAYRSHGPELSFFPGADALLAKLRQHGVRLGLITDGMASVQWRKIHALGLPARMDIIIATDELPKGSAKPSPTAFEVALLYVGATPTQAVYIGNDRTKDFVAPNALGMHSICIEHPGAPKTMAASMAHDARECVRSMADLSAALGLL